MLKNTAMIELKLCVRVQQIVTVEFKDIVTPKYQTVAMRTDEEDDVKRRHSLALEILVTCHRHSVSELTIYHLFDQYMNHKKLDPVTDVINYIMNTDALMCKRNFNVVPGGKKKEEE
ncbi:hypothetical protein F2P81_010866 [Scophthalmus maximus]|uniref:Uncharacterized protein n=1 Tax=Scophthalmus maximus TaxID=52904 RepID=A0A6A4T722_SCOMX|nr:hypothetical protein F2P81_010866 [Scophthalmus maximus]